MWTMPPAVLQSAAPPGPSVVTWNLLDKTVDIALTNGNLTAAGVGSSAGQVRATVSHDSSGKWYFEIVVHGVVSSTPFMGIRPGNALGGSGPFDGGGDYGVFMRSPNDGFQNYVPGSAGPATGGTVLASDVFMFAVDLDNLKFWRGRNGTWASGDPNTNTGGVSIGSGPWFPWTALSTSGASVTGHFASADFSYAAPTGFSEW